MLTLLNSQLLLLEESFKQQYVDRVADYLKKNLPNKVKPFDKQPLDTLIKNGIKKARAYSIKTEWDVCRFVQYQVRLGENFDKTHESSWAVEILKNPELNGPAKMDYMDYYYFYVLKETE